MQTHRFAFLFLVIFALTGCVGIEDYERKTDEAAGLRGEITKTEDQIKELHVKIEELEGRIKQKDLENQELSQSLTMARRHSQQTETRVGDLRAQDEFPANAANRERQESHTFRARVQRRYQAGS